MEMASGGAMARHGWGKWIALTVLMLAPPVQARVTGLHWDGPPQQAFGNTDFPGVGRYQLLTGQVEGTLDPHSPLNRGIVNLDKVATDAQGLVHYRADVMLVRPVDLARGNGTLLYDVPNRGGQLLLTRQVNGRGSGDPALASSIGTGYLMRQGYTMVWSGWQDGVPSVAIDHDDGSVSHMLAGHFPTAFGVTAEVREEIVFDTAASDVYTVAYPAADPDPARTHLTVRERVDDAQQTPKDLGFEWIDATHLRIHRPKGFDAGAIYELVYPARDPVVTGIGLAATRDVVDFLRRSAADDAGNPNPLLDAHGQIGVQHAIGLGVSQSGRFLRDVLAQGFNHGESGQRVFDGVMAIIAGSRKSMANAAFSKAGDFSRQHETHLARGDQFPFTYATTTDPVSGRSGGIMAAMAPADQPRLFHIDSDTEIYQARAALVSTTADGKPIVQPPNVRLYFTGGSQHGASDHPAHNPVAQQLTNPLDNGDLIRALLSDLQAWVVDDVPPPDSRYPSVADGTLVPPLDPRAAFPAIPGFAYHGVTNVLRVKDDTDPAVRTVGAAYPAWMAAHDADGNNIAGIRHPLLAAPLGTHTGWNPRRPGFAEGELSSLDGSYLPFARTRAERERTGDPRPSLEERYGTVEAWIRRVDAASQALVRQRLLLPEDAQRLHDAASERGYDLFDTPLY